MNMFEVLEQEFTRARADLEDYLRSIGLPPRQISFIMQCVDLLCELSTQMEQEGQ